MNQKQILTRYYREFFISMGAYVIAVIITSFLLARMELSKPVQIVLALVPVIPTLFVIIAILRMMRDSDELFQKIQLQAVTLSAITTGLITFAYGFLENVGFPPFPTLWVLPIMFAMWGISLGYFIRKYQ
jgi:ABC-type cobalamin transport system permease subunit